MLIYSHTYSTSYVTRKVKLIYNLFLVQQKNIIDCCLLINYYACQEEYS